MRYKGKLLEMCSDDITRLLFNYFGQLYTRYTHCYIGEFVLRYKHSDNRAITTLDCKLACMASVHDNGDGDVASGGERMYKQEYSLYVDVGDNKAVKPKELIKEVNKLTGNGNKLCMRP